MLRKKTFTCKSYKPVHTSVPFNNSLVQKISTQKHLGLIFDKKLDFQEHLKAVHNITNKSSIGTLRKLQKKLT